MENLADSIRTLNSQLQQTIVMLNESILLQLPRGQQNEHLKEAQTVNLLSQM